jgi:hypothetical protein
MRPAPIARRTIGEVPRPFGATEFARRVDEAIYAVLNELALGTSASPRRRDKVMYGREHESRQARTQFTALSVMQKPAE